ncbi:MAG: hypothetical protein U9N85_09275 [Bacteroidota bacterium]|nr:hypothetical protein [Bacteroidota bacterium]
MNKQTNYIFLALTVLAFFVTSCTESVDPERKIIPVNIDDIRKIEFSNAENQTILNKKTTTSYTVNGEETDPRNIYDFLKMANSTEIKVPASNADNDSIKKQLIESGIHIKFYNKKDKLQAHWVFGEYSEKYDATEFMNAGSQNVFMVEIPGKETNLTAYYSSLPDFWINHLLLSYRYNEILEVRIDYYGKDSVNSFDLSIQKDSVRLKDYTGKQLRPINLLAVGQYLTYFENIYFYSSDTELSAGACDSVLGSSPVFRLLIKDTKKEITELKLFTKINPQTHAPDIHTAYLQTGETNVLKEVKYYEFDLLTKWPNYFISKE